MNFGIDPNRSGGGIAVTEQQLDECCSSAAIRDKMASSDTVRDGHVKKPWPEARKPPPAVAATTLAATNEDDSEESFVLTTNSKTTKNHDIIFNSKIAFPLNLTRMLESVEREGWNHIVHWSKNEESFVICDIDSFLREVLPIFFKSSDKTKIRSFYRKLNRWGFSMSRKNAYNTNSIWHHPEFNRAIAVQSLNQSFEIGKAVDFLNMNSISKESKGKRRRGIVSFNEDELSIEDDDATSTTAMDGTDTSNFHRRILSQSTNRASMPTLPSAKSSMICGKKHGKLSHSFTERTQHQQKNMLIAPSNLHYSQPTQAFGKRTTKAPSNRLSPSRGGKSNATFDLLCSRTSGMTPPPYNNFAPSRNIFALSAQEMLSAHCPTNNIGHSPSEARTRGQPMRHSWSSRRPTPSISENYTLFATETNQRQPLQSEMTEEEDQELMAFLENFAKTLPPPEEGDEEKYGGEPDILPRNF